MKTMALLVSVLAMVGFAEAWDTVDTVQYQFTHAMYEQAGYGPVNNGEMAGATSTVSFSAPNPYATGTNAVASGSITNKLDSASATVLGADGTTPLTPLQYPSQTDTLTQGGSVSLKTSALDSQDNKPEMAMSLNKFQNLHFSGIYQNVGAAFSDFGSVGIADAENPANNIQLFEISKSVDPSIWAYGSGTDNGVTFNARFTESDVGVQSSSGLTYDMVNNAKTLSGSSTAYASFTGGILANNGIGNTPGNPGFNYIQITTGDFYTQTWYTAHV